MKKTIARCLTAAVVLLSISPLRSSDVYAGEVAQPSVSAAGYVVMDADSGEILLGKEADTPRHPASITKILTTLVVAEECQDLEQKVIASEEAVNELSILSSTLQPVTKAGEQMSVRDLLYGLVMKSGNECANVLAEFISGDVETFAEQMNGRAALAGAANSHFANAHGLDDEEHYASPHDMALIMSAALKNEVAREILSAKAYTIANTNLNGARALYSGHSMVSGTVYCEGVFAGKTGYTPMAESTLVTAATRHDRNLICVVMGSESAGGHYTDTKILLEYAFAQIEGKTPSSGLNVYGVSVSDMDQDGFTLTWTTGEMTKQAKGLAWTVDNGADDLTEVLVAPSDHSVSFRVKYAEHGQNQGVYTAQIFVYDDAGNEMVRTVKVLATTDSVDIRNAFIEQNGVKYYIKGNGTLALEWLELKSGGGYLFDTETAAMQTGLKTVGKSTYYLDEDGKVQTGFVELDGATYYFQAPGDMATGLILIGNQIYYFDEGGVLRSGVIGSTAAGRARKILEER